MEQATRPLRRDAERNRQRIVHAAREVFAERGLTASLDDIARHAEVGVGTVYRRFPDKQLLIDALFEERIAEVVDAFEQGLAHPDPWEGLVSTLETVLEAQALDLGLKELLLVGSSACSGLDEARRRIAPLGERLLSRAQADGSVREDAVPSDIPMLQLSVGSLIDATRDVEPELWRRYLAIALDGLRARRDGPTPLPVEGLSTERVPEVLHACRPRR